jgi:uncharacterized protein
MGLLRIILIVIAFIIIYRMIRHFLAKAKHEAGTPAGKPTDIVPCAICGVHIPRDTAIRKNERYYCSQDHANQE